MTDNNKHILLVDDDEHLIEIMKLHFTHEGYTTYTAFNGKLALEILEKHAEKIQVIISDVNMPEMDGYEFCQAIRKATETKSTPFIFLSNLATLEEKLRGFSTGADDYIPKPIDLKELLIKVGNILENKAKQVKLNERLKESNKMVFQAMGYSSFLGRVLQFMQNSADILEFDLLAEEVFKTTMEFDLNCIIQFNAEDMQYHFSSQGEITPLEKNILELLGNSDKRFYDFGARTTVNYTSFSLLIKNMPIDDEERYGMLKDILGNLGEAIHARATAIKAYGVNEKRKNIITSVNESIQNIDNSFKTIQNGNLSAIEGLLEELEEAMITLALTEEQEEKIRNAVKRCYDKINTIFQESSVLNIELENISSRLGSEWSQ